MQKLLLLLLFILASCTKSPNNFVLLDITIKGPAGPPLSLSERFIWGEAKVLTPSGYRLIITPSVENRSEIVLKIEVNKLSKLLGKAKLTTIFNYPATINIIDNAHHYKLTLTPRK
ncbi:MAG: hypothetical protein KAG61_04480 [Bacteriovoracaceae bacterium]|nr:hypothetical protein [Bacteriovoracaceae bacterium]